MSTGARRYDDRYKPYLILFILILTIAGWFLAVNLTYKIPHERIMQGYWFALLATPFHAKLIVPSIFLMTYGIVVAAIVNNYTTTWFEGGDFLYRLRGTKMVSLPHLRDITREFGKRQLKIMSVLIPKMKEYLHYLFIGSTGSGKSQAIATYIDSAHKRGDRTITVDPNGGFMATFWKPGDIILNPFDERGAYWSIYHEIRTPYDVENYAKTIIPKSPDTSHEEWNAMARGVVAEVMQKLAQLKRGSTLELIKWLCEKSNDELKTMLAGTAAAGLFHGAEETLGSVRAVLTRYVMPHKYLEGGREDVTPFSIREWLENGTGNLWITWREDMLEALKPIISCWIDVISAASLSSDVEASVDIHLIIDEFDSLEKLNNYVQLATKSRKHMMHLATGIQSHAQLDKTNGKEDALTIRNSLRNTFVFGISAQDTYTAAECSKALGNHSVVRKRSTSQSGGRGSSSNETVDEPLVTASQIQSLPDLTGYIKLSGDTPLARATMKYKKWPRVTEGIIMANNKWTQDFADMPMPRFNEMSAAAAATTSSTPTILVGAKK